MNRDSLLPAEWLETLRALSLDSTTVQVFLIVLAAAVLDFILRRLIHRLHKHIAAKTENPWDDALLEALVTPVSVFVWIVGLWIASAMLGGVFADPRAGQFFTVALIADAAWFLVRWISRIEDSLVELQKDKPEDERLDPTTVHAVGKLLRLSAMITSILVVLGALEIDVSAVLAFGGIGGIAIGFASKDLLSNFFGGLMIYLDKPFKVGDWIRSPDREIEGTVESIGWRLTLIRTFDKRPLYVPNAIFNTIAIENPQRMLNRRIYETIGIRYGDISKMDAITKEVEQMLRAHPEIDTSLIMMVYFNTFGPSSCDFFVYTFTKTTKWAYYHSVKHDVLLKIAKIIESHGAQIAFPTSTIHIPNGLPAPTPPSQES